jgi:predicted transposase YbfD/YdcC
LHKTQTTSEETAYYISSLTSKIPAENFGKGVRGHWGIESSLHFTKDKTFLEDASKVRTKNSPQNMSLIRNIAINVFRKNNYSNIAQAIRLVANDISKIKTLLLA